MAFDRLVQSDKLIARFPGWSDPEAETGALWFLAPLEINGVVEADFVLAGVANYKLPERAVTFELRIGSPTTRRKIPLARLDWRSVTGHLNHRRMSDGSTGKRVSTTHYHSFDLNWSAAERRMRGKNLPRAQDLEEEPQSFESLREQVGNLFRISNIDVVSRPPWEYNLFSHG